MEDYEILTEYLNVKSLQEEGEVHSGQRIFDKNKIFIDDQGLPIKESEIPMKGLYFNKNGKSERPSKNMANLSHTQIEELGGEEVGSFKLKIDDSGRPILADKMSRKDRDILQRTFNQMMLENEEGAKEEEDELGLIRKMEEVGNSTLLSGRQENKLKAQLGEVIESDKKRAAKIQQALENGEDMDYDPIYNELLHSTPKYAQILHERREGDRRIKIKEAELKGVEDVQTYVQNLELLEDAFKKELEGNFVRGTGLKDKFMRQYTRVDTQVPQDEVIKGGKREKRNKQNKLINQNKQEMLLEDKKDHQFSKKRTQYNEMLMTLEHIDDDPEAEAEALSDE